MSANGRLTDDELVVIPGTGGQRIAPGLLASVVALRAAFEAEFDKPLQVVEAYRSYATQEYLYDGWRRRLPGFNLASPPGNSPHGYGLAIDFGSNVNVYDSPEKEWMDENAPAYGWSPTGNTFSPREAWHFVGGGPVTASLTAHILTEIGATSMSAIRVISSPSYVAAGQQVIHNGTVVNAIPAGLALSLRQGGVESHDYDQDYQLVNEVNAVYMLQGLEGDELKEQVGKALGDVIKQQQQ